MNQAIAPVALFAFNRPETTRRVFDAISAARPPRLLLITDGPRPGNVHEAGQCAQVKRIVSQVDWPCDVETNFSEVNLGCRLRMVSGLNWVFSRVENAIILEDDCLPDPTFFPYCSELLERYKDNLQIALVSGFNALDRRFPFAASYYYSLPTTFSIWGWASWRRTWQEYDEHLSTWPEVREAKLLHAIFGDDRAVAYWTDVFDRMHAGTGPSTWDYQLVYMCWMKNWLGIVPGKNLIRNIGIGANATHTKKVDPAWNTERRSLGFPLLHPPAITAWPGQLRMIQKALYTPGIARKLRRSAARLRARLRWGP